MTAMRVVALVLTALLVAACGGGEGGGPDHPFQGLYGYVQVTWHPDYDYPVSTVGRLTVSTDGTVTQEGERGVRDGVAQGALNLPFAWSATGAGTIVLHQGQARRYDADISPDGTMVVATSRRSGDTPTLLVLARRSTAFTQADLAGNWEEMSWAHTRVEDGGVPLTGSTAVAQESFLDPSGGVTPNGGFWLLFGELWLPPDAFVPTTEVRLGPSDEVHWHRTQDDVQTHQGHLAEGGSLMLLGGEYADHTTGLTLCVRDDQSIQPGDVSGTYRIAGIGSSVFGSFVRWGSVTLGPSITGTCTYEDNVQGTILGSGSASVQFTHLEGANTMLMGWNQEFGFSGTAGPNGDWIVVSGEFVSGGSQAQLYVFVR